MRRTLNRVRERYHELGLAGLIARLAGRALSRVRAAIYSKHAELLIVKTLDGHIGFFGESELQIQTITADHSSLLRAFNARYRATSAAALDCYLKHAYKGFIAFVNGEPVGFWWWVGSDTRRAITHPCLDRFELNLKSDEVYGFDYFIAPEYRGRGAAVKLLTLIYRNLESLGYRKVWAFVDAGNAPARWVYKTHGNRIVRRISGHEFLSIFLVQEGKVFLRNTRWTSRQAFDRSLLFSFKPKISKNARGATHDSTASRLIEGRDVDGRRGFERNTAN